MFVVYLSFAFFLLHHSHGVDLSDAHLTTPQLITKYGYEGETHYVTTEDGYILQMHRIVKSPKMNTTTHKNVVFLMHGITTSSGDFVMAGPNISLGYYLSDLSYDVWLGNSRGNRYSRSHTTKSPESSKFWEFTFHEMGVYDLPACIDYILATTNRKTLSYIGFSQGTTQFFVMCSERPEYQRKISLMQALAPVAFLYRTRNKIIRLTSYLTNTIETKFLKKPPYELTPHTTGFRDFIKILCTSQVKTVCSQLLFKFVGVDYKYLDEKLLVVAAGHIPAGVSNRDAAHFGQLAVEDRFGMFDYGSRKNFKKYGQKTPPDYHLANNTVPIVLIYSKNDIVSFPADIFRLRDILPNLVEYHEPLYKEYNHADYIIGKGVRETLYTRMADTLNRYS